MVYNFLKVLAAIFLPPERIFIANKLIFSVHIQNIQRHNVQAAKRPKYKTFKDITSKLQNVPAAKRPSLKTSQASKRPKTQNIPAPKHPEYKTSKL